MSTVNAASIIESINRIQLNSQQHQTFAWVAVTGKPELFVRDHLGADLSAHNPGVIVSREWNKHDLVILDGEVNPLVVIEGKALYDFDLLDPRILNDYRKALAIDRQKLIDRDAPKSFMTLLMTSIRNPVPDSLRRVTKYSSGINRGLKKHGADLMPKAVAEARLFLSEFGEIVHEAQLISGTAVGCDVCVWMWLVEVNVLFADPRIA
jgi:hypothetical protein